MDSMGMHTNRCRTPTCTLTPTPNGLCVSCDREELLVKLETKFADQLPRRTEAARAGTTNLANGAQQQSASSAVQTPPPKAFLPAQRRDNHSPPPSAFQQPLDSCPVPGCHEKTLHTKLCRICGIHYQLWLTHKKSGEHLGLVLSKAKIAYFTSISEH